LLKDLGEDGNIITNFQRYANDKVTPNFNEAYKCKSKDHNGELVEITVPAFSEVTFQIAAKPSALNNSASVDSEDGEAKSRRNIRKNKISKGRSNLFGAFFTRYWNK